MPDKFDEMLSAALSECFDEEIKAIEHMEKVQPSAQWKKDVLSLCKKEKARTVFRFRRILGRCAIFVLVLFSSVSLMLLTAPEVQGAVQEVILKWTDKSLEFNFEGKSAFLDAVSVNVTYLPNGYRLTDSFDSLPDLFEYSWNDHEEWEWERQISLSGIKISEGAAQGIDNEHGDITDIAFSAQDVIYLKSNTPGYPSYLSWTEDGYSMLLMIPKTFSDEVIIKIAEGVELIY